MIVEALVGNRASAGLDLSPVAVRLTRLKCQRRAPRERAVFLSRLRDVAARSEARVRSRTYVVAPLTAEERAFYSPHTLKELAGLREEILTVEDRGDREALMMVLSAIVLKFSRQRAETSPTKTAPRIRKGLPTEFFVRKGEELEAAWAALFEASSKSAPRPHVVEGDALELPRGLPKDFRADLILTSPPYGGTYDYAMHHARREPWLGLSSKELARREIGARRNLRGPDAIERWERELLGALRAMRRVMSPSGRAVLLIGDAQLGGERVPADLQVRDLAARAGLVAVAAASEPRPDFTGGDDRREHLVLLEPSQKG